LIIKPLASPVNLLPEKRFEVFLVQEQCEVELLRLAQHHTNEDKIIHLLEASRYYEFTIEEAAQKLNLSKSTLIRKLRQ
jgi:AraC-like DNA-binding protein